MVASPTMSPMTFHGGVGNMEAIIRVRAFFDPTTSLRRILRKSGLIDPSLELLDFLDELGQAALLRHDLQLLLHRLRGIAEIDHSAREVGGYPRAGRENGFVANLQMPRHTHLRGCPLPTTRTGNGSVP